MAYITQSEIEKAIGAGELIDLADHDGDGAADAAVVAAHIARADGVIESYLRARYTLPLAATPDLVREIAIHLVRYTLADQAASDRTRDDYKQAIKWLGEIREGKLDIGLTSDGGDVPPTEGGPQFAPGRDAFPQDALDRFGGAS